MARSPALAHTVVVGLQSLFGSATNVRGKRRGARERGRDRWMAATAVHVRTKPVGVMLAWRARAKPSLSWVPICRAVGSISIADAPQARDKHVTHRGPVPVFHACAASTRWP
ncbi:hypothetical protein DFH08DRAFT_822012 [Mycena albidolilacea]|uniref:Uncharacterized protein n=1 Tax=Mycena albidolilacea TaxID=1033008 RepID=A0AAD6Z9K5_9AGAR|nr:hypothetical protein DFH08DRAFT_822012 [Mycena albidolilacea]